MPVHQSFLAPIVPYALESVAGTAVQAMPPGPVFVAQPEVAAVLRNPAVPEAGLVVGHRVAGLVFLPELAVALRIPCSVVLVHSSRTRRYHPVLLLSVLEEA